MKTIEDLKNKIGESVYQDIENEADKEVSLAMTMPLKDKWGKEKYYRLRPVLGLFLEECFIFEENGLKISPLDIFIILFNCKIFLASSSENEYHQRSGGVYFHDEYRFTISWSEKGKKLETLVSIFFSRLISLQKERVLMTNINSFRTSDLDYPGHSKQTAQEFFVDLFETLNIPFTPFFEGEHLIDLYKKVQPNLVEYNIEKANYLFQPPSLGHMHLGSEMYCRLYSSSWLRTLLNMIRIVNFIYPAQIDFGNEKAGFNAPTTPVFLGQNTWGGFCWDEDTQECWSKIPDGCLVLSFGYRGLSEMWIDHRTFGSMKKFLIEYKIIFEQLKNPWSIKNLHDVFPILDILSSATQMPDNGAKILQIYCCLEHLFVPENVTKDNKKYIVGGLNAIRPELIDWFNDLYKLRCQYAHKGFVLRDEKTRGFINISIENIMKLLLIKVSIE